MAAKGARESITLACSDCKRRNYTTEKNKKKTCAADKVMIIYPLSAANNTYIVLNTK